MSTAQWFASKASTNSTPNTHYCTLPSGHAGPSTTESAIRAPNRVAGTYSKLYIRVNTNDRTATSTLTFRTGGADGNQSVSIGAGLTGDFMDASNTDAVAGSGELIDIKLIVGSGGTAFTWALISVVFTPSSGQAVRFEALGAGTSIGPSTTQYQALSSLGSTQTTEASEQHKIRLSGTLENLFANISVNSLNTATTTIRTKINGAAGAQSVAIGAGLTGVFEDTTNTDAVVAGDLVNYQTSTGAGGTGALSYGNIGCDLTISSGNQYQLACATNNGASVNQNTTMYATPSGQLTPNATEDSVKGRINSTGFAASKLQTFVITNTMGVAVTVRTRKNSTNGAQSISIGAGLTGFFEDATNSDSYATNDYMAYQVVAPSSGANAIRMNNLGVLVTPVGIIAAEGVASTLAFGTDKLNPTVLATGLASTLAFGTALLNPAIIASGIASTESFGTHKLNPVILVTSVPSTLSFGVANLFIQGIIGPISIDSTASLGLAQLNPIILGTGIASTLSFGTLKIIAVVAPISIASAASFGTAKLNLIIMPSSLESGLAFGSTRLSSADSQLIVAPSIVSTVRIGGHYLIEITTCIRDWEALPIIGPSGFQAERLGPVPPSGVSGWD